jgi:hypothetical protein
MRDGLSVCESRGGRERGSENEPFKEPLYHSPDVMV